MNANETTPRHPNPYTADLLTGTTPPPPPANNEDDPWPEDNATPTQKREWFTTFAILYSNNLSDTYLARARRLHGHGWTPNHLAAACDTPQDADDFDSVVGMTATEAEDHSVLLDEVATYFTFWANQVTTERNRYVRRLDEQDWTATQIASLLGVSQEQAHDIVKAHAPVEDDFPKGVPRLKPGTPVFPLDGSALDGSALGGSENLV